MISDHLHVRLLQQQSCNTIRAGSKPFIVERVRLAIGERCAASSVDVGTAGAIMNTWMLHRAAALRQRHRHGAGAGHEQAMTEQHRGDDKLTRTLREGVLRAQVDAR
jgi:tartrate dehydratase alpha subunit/fumarate hydratase class I-like protein